ncbi:hypothetical protein [Nocardia sp. NPDC047038]|uniref:hypothetical protein n=1 Tax=Nocardia sp. NPDC047038 TaxID=3154338 RepID=UPI0033C07EEF
MPDPSDEALMTREQQALLLAVIDAINDARRPVTPDQLARYLADQLSPAPDVDDVTAITHILELPSVA